MPRSLNPSPRFRCGFPSGVSKTATAPLEAIRIKLMVGGSGEGRRDIDFVGAFPRADLQNHLRSRLPLSAGSTVKEVIANISRNGGLKGFFNGNLADVIRTAPQKSVQLASCALKPRLPVASHGPACHTRVIGASSVMLA